MLYYDKRDWRRAAAGPALAGLPPEPGFRLQDPTYLRKEEYVVGKRFALFIVLWTVILLIGCDGKVQKKEELPSEAFAAYLADWQRLDFEAMYKRLTPEVQAKTTAEAFAERYRKIYDGIEAKRLTVTAVNLPQAEASGSGEAGADEEASEASYTYKLSMETVAGPLQFEHAAKLVKSTVQGEDGKPETKWRIAWDPSYIFPEMADGDKVRVQTSKGERGEILDRNGNGLAVNGTARQVGIVPGQLGSNPEATKAKLAELLHIDVKEIDDKLAAKWVKPGLFVPVAIVSDDEMDKFEGLPGVDFHKKKIRVYPYAEATAHLTGYLGEISAEQLAKLKDRGYAAGDLIGKAGLEQVFEDRLRGKSGTRITITNAQGKEKAVLAETEAAPGETIRLTIDAELQKTIYDELKQEQASVAAIQPVTGDILALLSAPSYDPNAFVRGLSSEQYEAWNNDPKHPFLNRFTKGYAPGSSFKVVTAAIGLDTNTLDPSEKKTIAGLKWTKDGSWGSYYVKRVHDVNPVDLSKALIYSDNIYFAQAALAVGKDAFAEEAAKFGIEEDLPIPYPFRQSQLANEGIAGDIQLADTGYGQGELTMTSLHVALVYSALVNDGDIVYPVLTQEEGASAEGPRVWKARAMKPETAETLKNDLIQAVRSPEGVGHGAYIPGASIAGKTGTAELKLTKDGDGTENGWFVGFNAADPELLLAVMVEDVKAKGGSGYVTPKVKHIFQRYLNVKF